MSAINYAQASYMLPINTEVTLNSDFVPANADEEDMFNGSYIGRITDWQNNDATNEAEYHVTFDDTCTPENDYDVSIWVSADSVDLA